MKNSTKTLLFTLACCATSILVAGYTQLNGQSEVGDRASYLDPFLVDILAFAVAIFLVIEGIVRIVVNKDAELKSQATRSLRMAVGFAIITIHSIQVFYKFLPIA